MQRIPIKLSTVPILILFSVLLPPVLGQSVSQGGGSARAVHKRKTECESDVVASSLLMSFQESEPEVRVQAKTLCPLGAELEFTSPNGNALFSYSNGDHFLYMFPGGLYSHLLISVWEGGSHIGIRVFVVRGKSITKVFDKEIKAPPEFIPGSGDGVVLVLSRPKQGDPETEITLSDIYAWNGAELRLARTVSMEQRFSAVATVLSARQENR